MKKVSVLFAVMIAAVSMSAEPVLRHIDTNGPKGACLFKEDANGFAEYKAVVPFQTSTDEAIANVSAWAKGLGLGVTVKNVEVKDNIVSFHGYANINEDLSLYRVMVGDSARYYAKAESKLIFDCMIEVREGRLRFIFNNLIAERDGVNADFVENEGPVNDLYWNHMNGIQQQQAKVKGKAAKFEKARNFENKLYSIEDQLIADLAQSLKTSVMSYTEEEW